MGCGAELQAGTAFCAHCGMSQAAQAGAPTQAMAAPPPGPQAGGARVAPTMAMGQEGFAQMVPGAASAAVPGRPAGAPGGKAQAMTMMAGVGLGMSAAFNAGFANPFPGWRAELAEPIGPSTGGGKQSIQPITLIAPTGEKLAVGKVDPVRRYAQVRDFQLVSRMHQERFGRPLAMAMHDYNRWIESVRSFFSSAGLNTEYEDASAALEAAAPRSSGTSVLVWIVVALVVAGLIAVIVWAVTR